MLHPSSNGLFFNTEGRREETGVERTKRNLRSFISIMMWKCQLEMSEKTRNELGDEAFLTMKTYESGPGCKPKIVES